MLLFQWFCHRKNNASQNAPTFTPRMWCAQCKSLPFGVNAKASNWSLSLMRYCSSWVHIFCCVDGFGSSKYSWAYWMCIQTGYLLRRCGKIPVFAGGRDQPFWKRPPASMVTAPSPFFSKKRFEHIWTEIVPHLPPFHSSCLHHH